LIPNYPICLIYLEKADFYFWRKNMASSVKASKNNPTNRKEVKGKMVTSHECENCGNKCAKGIAYLQAFSQKRVGRGVHCEKVR
jgi:hypothetical protein